MRQAVIAIVAMTCLAACVRPAAAQGLPSVGFKNETPIPIIIQGCTVVGGVQRRGAPLLLNVNRIAFDVNVPTGVRLYSVFNANQPAQVLLRDFPVPLTGGEVRLLVRMSKQNAGQVELVLPGAAP